VTEEEAKTKWCPFARQMITLDRDPGGVPIAIGSANRYSGAEVAACMGSACMAWRWNTRKEDFGAKTVRMDSGFCGLAGKP